VPLGTVVASEIDVADVGRAEDKFIFTTSFAGVESKLVPVIDTVAPTAPIVGVKFVIVGWPLLPETVNAVDEVAAPAGEVTEIVPVVAPFGTKTINCVALAEVTVAAVPLNWTVSWLGVTLKPVPLIVTVVPVGPLVGTKPTIEVCDDGLVEIESKFPTAS
jgi:hypothetical protein